MAADKNNDGLSAEEAEVLDSVIDPEYPERLREVALHLFEALLLREELRSMDKAVLAEMALQQTERLSVEMGGGNFYMHKGVAYRLTRRDREMCAKFTGRNYHQLARDHDLSEMRVRQIIDAWQKEEFARRQGGLFGGEKGLQKKRA